MWQEVVCRNTDLKKRQKGNTCRVQSFRLLIATEMFSVVWAPLFKLERIASSKVMTEKLHSSFPHIFFSLLLFLVKFSCSILKRPESTRTLLLCFIFFYHTQAWIIHPLKWSYHTEHVLYFILTQTDRESCISFMH